MRTLIGTSCVCGSKGHPAPNVVDDVSQKSVGVCCLTRCFSYFYCALVHSISLYCDGLGTATGTTPPFKS